MAKINIHQEVIEAQSKLDEIVPGKVKVSLNYDPDTGTPILCGTYQDRHGEWSHWTERMDRYYTDCGLFLMFFKQRKRFMMASREEQLAFDGHPSQYWKVLGTIKTI